MMRLYRPSTKLFDNFSIYANIYIVLDVLTVIVDPKGLLTYFIRKERRGLGWECKHRVPPPTNSPTHPLILELKVIKKL